MIRQLRLAISLLLLALSTAGVTTALVQPSNHAIEGSWRGPSVCLVTPSACHDEEALYQVRRNERQPGWFSMEMDKIVEGKPEFMATVDCRFNEGTNVFHCDFGRGYLDLTLEAGRLDGGMFLPDKTPWRKIRLRRVKS